MARTFIEAKIFTTTRPFVLLLTMVLVLLQSVQAEDTKLSTAESAQRFKTIVERNFEIWDTDNSGRLSPDEIDNDIQDPSIKGENAAALSAIKVYLRHIELKGEGGSGFTLDSLNPYNDDSRTLSDSGKTLVSLFTSYKGTIGKESVKLFPKGMPHIESIMQGRTGDCYFLATVGGMAYHQPVNLVNMVTWQPDGSYLVKFPRHKPIPVPAPTDCEIACYSHDDDDGLWLDVIEKAYGIFKERRSSDSGKADALDLVISGGSGGRMIMFLTGNACLRYSTAKANPSELRQHLQNALADNRIANTGTPGHSLTVLAYDPGTDTITIWNPWGTSDFYKAAGKMMDHGVFTMPFNDFTQRFPYLLIEQDRPATTRDYYNLRHHS